MPQSVMQHDFSRVPHVSRPRASFNRTHGHKTTFNSGYLIPVFVDEALPGDTFKVNMTAYCRLATPLHPFMDNMFLESFWFAVPLRLLQTNFQKLMGEQDNPDDSIDFLTPIITVPTTTGFVAESIYDYMGLPVGVDDIGPVCAYALRAYNRIWNEWFRDENLQDSVSSPVTDGPDAATLYTLLRRGKRHDYFTSCLPFPQKGPDVDLPLGTTAPVHGLYVVASSPYDAVDATARGVFPQTASGDGASGNMNFIDAAANGKTYIAEDPAHAGYPRVYADLADAAAATVNQLRQAVAMQQLFEIDARGGTRYTEIILAHFGVRSDDARLQRPEFLGGGSSNVNITPVAQMSETTVDSPQGNLAAIGTATMNRHGFTKSFTEHCIIIGLVSARADLNYQQGLNRMWSRRTKYDFYWPTLAAIGEQAVLNKEIMAQGTAADEEVFGYQERWAEYRYKPSLITGQFRSSFATSLDTWHLAQDFGTLPVLNDEFIVDDPPVDRVIAVPSEPHFLFDSVMRMSCARAMPMYGVPGLRRF